MKNRAAGGIKQTTYGVSIGGLPLQVAKTWQRKNFNTKLNGDQLKKRCFAPTFVSTAQRFSSSATNVQSKVTLKADDYGLKCAQKSAEPFLTLPSLKKM